MNSMSIWLAALFLPIFPASMLFNALRVVMPSRWLRAAVILVWPQVGVWLLNQAQPDLPDWWIWAALATSLLYAIRMLAMRDVSRWVGFLATSTWSLLWLASTIDGLTGQQLHLFALWFSVPLAMLSVFVGELKQRFGAAFTGLNMALASSLPRLSGVLVVGVLAAIATPLFPGFFVMLNLLGTSTVGFSLTVVTIWFIWSWAAARMIQGLIVGTRAPDDVVDMGRAGAWLSALVFAALVVVGVMMTEVLS